MLIYHIGGKLIPAVALHVPVEVLLVLDQLLFLLLLAPAFVTNQTTEQEQKNEDAQNRNLGTIKMVLNC